MKKKIKLVLFSIILSASNSLFCQVVNSNGIFISGGVYHLNPNFKYGNIGVENSGERLPFISNAFGIKFYREKQYFYWGYGLSIVQNRYKSKSFFLYTTKSTMTKAYLSVPIFLGFKANNFKFEIGAGIDYFLYEYVNYSYFNNGIVEEVGRDADDYNSFDPWCLSFLQSTIPLSLHLQAEIGTTFNIMEKHEAGISLNLRMSEILSLYGRNYSLTGYELNSEKYYAPISLSVSLYYFIGRNK
jgi:hypothetical protein